MSEIKKDAYNLDAGETAFFRRELEHVKAKTYDKKFKKLKATSLIPVSTEAPSGAAEITYKSYTKIGVAKIIADYAHDFPRVDIYGEEKTAKCRGIGESYGYSIEEIRRAQMAGTSLETRRANAARRANDEKVNTIAWTGDSDYQLQGLINFPGITEYTVQNGAAASKTWASKTPDEIIKDLNGIVTAIVDSTNGVEAPDTLIIPIAQYTYINDTRMTGDSDKTILQFFLKNNEFIKTVDWVVELKGAGDAGTDRMMVYERNPEQLTLEIPQPFEQFAPDKKGMEYEIPCHSKTGGVIVYYPQSVAYGDGI
jgi:hypothetical protein